MKRINTKEKIITQWILPSAVALMIQVTTIHTESQQIKSYVGFSVRGENRTIRWKTCHNRVQNQQFSMLRLVKKSNPGRVILVEDECSHNCANPALRAVH